MRRFVLENALVLNNFASSDPAPKLFALVIGINEYPELKSLNGAVSDARSVVDYLRMLSVPNEHIVELYDERATRFAIINQFQQLADDQRIGFGDAILVYFAGHGCEIDAPQGWESNNKKIQGLVPFDVKTLNERGQYIEVIPDLTIASLLDEIAESKGNNITVIFDSCYSASGTRAHGEDSDTLARVVESKYLPPLSSATDKDIIYYSAPSIRTSITPATFIHRALRSHVLLAACGSTEVAWERSGRGEFTTALLSILKASSPDSLTYMELMDKLPPIKQ